jgi:hypothetical protein
MLAPIRGLPAEQRRLLKLFGRLSEADRHALFAFADFLAQRAAEPPPEGKDGPPPEPLDIPRPETESVVGAIKRLSKSYFMLDRSTLFNETSSLMTAHVIHGRPVAQVIDELEGLFQQRYRDHLEFWNHRQG